MAFFPSLHQSNIPFLSVDPCLPWLKPLPLKPTVKWCPQPTTLEKEVEHREATFFFKTTQHCQGWAWTLALFPGFSEESRSAQCSWCHHTPTPEGNDSPAIFTLDISWCTTSVICVFFSRITVTTRAAQRVCTLELARTRAEIWLCL